MVPGHVAADDEHTANPIVFVDRTVAVGPVDLLQPAVARDRNELVLMPRRTAAAHHLLDLGTDNVPDFRPALPSALTERARMALGSHGLAIGVIVELNEFFAPPDEHRMVGIQQDAQRGPQTLRPGFRKPERTCRPVVGPGQAAHLPAAGEEIRKSRSVDLQHSGRSVGQFSPNWQPELNPRSHYRQTHRTASGPKYIFNGWNQTGMPCARAPLTIALKRHGLAAPQAPLFHEARRRERAGDDRTDVDTATPRRARRLGTAAGFGTAAERRERPQHRGEIRHLYGCRRNLRSWLDGLLGCLLRSFVGSFLGRFLRSSFGRFGRNHFGLANPFGQAKEIRNVIGRRDSRLDQERTLGAVSLV